MSDNLFLGKNSTPLYSLWIMTAGCLLFCHVHIVTLGYPISFFVTPLTTH